MRKYQQSLAHERELDVRLQELQDEHHKKAEANFVKYEEKRISVREHQVKQEQERERVFRERAEKIDKARTQGTQNKQELVEKAKERREKCVNTWTVNRQKTRKERYDWTQTVSAKVEEHAARSERYKSGLDETVVRLVERREVLDELVEQNKERIQRSAEHAREQTLAKVLLTKTKIETMLANRQQISDMRTVALKESMVSRGHLERIKHIMRDASTKRINQALKDLDMPQLPTSPKKEGEEGQHQQ